MTIISTVHTTLHLYIIVLYIIYCPTAKRGVGEHVCDQQELCCLPIKVGRCTKERLLLTSSVSFNIHLIICMQHEMYMLLSLWKPPMLTCVI